MTLLYYDCTNGRSRAIRTFAKNIAAPKNSQGLATQESKIVRIYVNTHPIFNMVDRLMKIQLQKRSCPVQPFSARGFKSASRVSTPVIVDYVQEKFIFIQICIWESMIIDHAHYIGYRVVILFCPDKN